MEGLSCKELPTVVGQKKDGEPRKKLEEQLERWEESNRVLFHRS